MRVKFNGGDLDAPNCNHIEMVSEGCIRLNCESPGRIHQIATVRGGLISIFESHLSERAIDPLIHLLRKRTGLDYRTSGALKTLKSELKNFNAVTGTWK